MAPQPLLMALAIGSHLLYGGVWGAIAAGLVDRMTVWTGIALGVLLWLIMQTLVLPYLGWGLFGAAVTPKIAVATLLLHLVYGGTVGLVIDRQDTARMVTS